MPIIVKVLTALAWIGLLGMATWWLIPRV